jgi:DNA mismatch repair ATPase MutS
VCALQVVAVAATFCEVWSSVSDLVAELDVLAGFADLATADPTRPYCKPEILELDDGVVELKVNAANSCNDCRLPVFFKECGLCQRAALPKYDQYEG